MSSFILSSDPLFQGTHFCSIHSGALPIMVWAHDQLPAWIKSLHCPPIQNLASHCVCVCVLVAQSHPTLCDPVDCNLWGSSVHGILQARILEWLAISFSRGCPWSWDGIQVSRIAGRFFTAEPLGKPLIFNIISSLSKMHVLAVTAQSNVWASGLLQQPCINLQSLIINL